MADKKKILVVEDEANIQLLLRTNLEKAGYQVFSAVDALQGVAMARQVAPNLIILDVMMPAGGGESVFERVKMISMTMHIPIIIHSACPRAEIEYKIPNLQDTEIITKPASPSEVVAAVKKLLPDD
jgi:two-component system response regulator RpaA